MKILKANKSDLPEILALQKLCYQENVARYNDSGFLPLKQTLDDLIDEFNKQIFLKAVAVDKIIGSVRGCQNGKEA